MASNIHPQEFQTVHSVHPVSPLPQYKPCQLQVCFATRRNRSLLSRSRCRRHPPARCRVASSRPAMLFWQSRKGCASLCRRRRSAPSFSEWRALPTQPCMSVYHNFKHFHACDSNLTGIENVLASLVAPLSISWLQGPWKTRTWEVEVARNLGHFREVSTHCRNFARCEWP